MTEVLLGARLVLAAVFVVAGAAKLADRKGTRSSLEDFGVPRALSGVGAITLPVVELVVGSALLSHRAALEGAITAAVLLAAFSAAVAVSLARGVQPNCHCFGQLHSAPVGARLLARNGALFGVAVFVAWAGRPDPGASAARLVDRLRVTEIGALVVLTIGAWLWYQLYLQHGRLLIRIDALERRLDQAKIDAGPADASGLPIGQPAPAFRASALGGGHVTLKTLVAQGRPVLLVFTDPSCGPCQELMPDIAAWQRDHGDDVTVALLSRGSIEASRAHAERLGVDNVLLAGNTGIAAAYQAQATPAAVLVDRDAKIASGVAAGAAAIRVLVGRVLGGQLRTGTSSARLRSGGNGRRIAPVPRPSISVGLNVDFRLPDLDGGEVVLADYLGQRVLLVNWNPRCAFCKQIASEIAKLARESESMGTTVILVSVGDVASNRALAERHRLATPIALMRGGQIDAFRGLGTPAAYLLDEQGRIASALALGADAVPRLGRAALRNGSSRGDS